MKINKNLTSIIKKYFIYLLPPILFFSYNPIILLGSDSSMNYELSLPLIWLLSFSIISLPRVYSFLKTNFKDKKTAIIISALFPIYSSITLIWSENINRAILTTGVIWCVWISIISIFVFLKKQKENRQFKKNLLKLFFITTTLVCLFCWIQCIFDIFNITRDTSLLCAGCTASSFGFPHPNGFAIEPQFMGNLLLFPSFLTLFFLFKKTDDKRKRIVFCILSILLISTLFLTMSRGAIYAFIIGLIVFLVFEIKDKKTLKPLLAILIVTFSLLFTLTFQGIFAETSLTNDTFYSGVSKVLNQMSLGIIDIPYELETKNNTIETNTSQFDGYVEISTTTRLDLSKLALKTWTSSPNIFIFGVGVGSGGKAMHAISPESLAEKEIVQNGYLEIALELGLIGIIILALNLIALIKIILRTEYRILTFPILSAFLVSYLFFSGLPNSLHIFLLPALLIATSKKLII